MFKGIVIYCRNKIDNAKNHLFELIATNSFIYQTLFPRNEMLFNLICKEEKGERR